MEKTERSKKIRLGVDVRILSQPMNGVARFTIALLKGLNQDGRFEVYLFSDTPLRDEYKEYLFDYKLISSESKKWKRYWKDWVLPPQLWRHKIDIYHATRDKGIPLLSPCPRVMTIHDLYKLSKSNIYLSRKKKLSRLLNLKLETAVCKKIFVVSENTKKDVVEKLGVKPEKIIVVHNDCDRDRIREAIATKDDRDRHYKDLYRSDYFISIVGRMDDVRKNIPFIVRAFHRFRNQNSSLNSKYKLVLVGNYREDDKHYKQLKDLIASYKLDKDVIITGYVEDDALYNLLSSSKVMIFPSLFEGFGIPLLEAFFLKVPVITSALSAMPEVADRSSALLINPSSEGELADAISSVCGDERLRARLIDSGLKRLDNFKWEDAMKKILAVYSDVK